METENFIANASKCLKVNGWYPLHWLGGIINRVLIVPSVIVFCGSWITDFVSDLSNGYTKWLFSLKILWLARWLEDKSEECKRCCGLWFIKILLSTDYILSTLLHNIVCNSHCGCWVLQHHYFILIQHKVLS